MSRFSRRRFLAASGAVAAAAAVPGRAARAGQPPAVPGAAPASAHRAKNLIFMVSDGMSTGTLTLADLRRRAAEGQPSAWARLWSRPGVRRASMRTHSADSLVTDSAAAGSAWGCGVHIVNGALNIDPEGRQRMPLFIQAAQAGKQTALVTTARITHATPASFVANAARRDYETVVARQQLERGVDVLLGGGARNFDQPLLTDHPEYTVVRDLAALQSARTAGGRLLGVFASSHVPYVLDRGPAVPSLPDMTRAALGRVGSAPEGFVMQIEAGRVDHAAHNNDAASLIAEQVEFDRTIEEVLAWIGERDDTLLIVTTDHANANPGLTLYGPQGKAGLEKVAEFKHSFDWISEQIPEHATDDQKRRAAADAVEQATGVRLNDSDQKVLFGALAGQREHPFLPSAKVNPILGGLLANVTGIAFASPNHTADMVEVTAFGPGAAMLAPGVIDNIDLWTIAVGALALPPGKPLPGMDEIVPLKSLPKAD